MNENTYQHILLNQLPVPQQLLQHYARIGLNETELIVLLQIHHFLHIGNDFPQPGEIAKFLTISENECVHILRKLIDKNILEIKELKEENGQWSEAYSLEPLWTRIYAVEEPKENEEGKLFVLFENEFGRPLSPFEIETINVWLDEDQLAPKIIEAALREAVLMDKLNFKYIDRILREWKRKGIQSVEQVKQMNDRFRKESTVKKYEPKKRDTSVYYNWLEGGK